jgi:hypothetical protein
MKHIKPMRLFDLSDAKVHNRVFFLESWEEEHLLECGECQDRIEIFASQAETAFDDEIAGSSKW